MLVIGKDEKAGTWSASDALASAKAGEKKTAGSIVPNVL